METLHTLTAYGVLVLVIVAIALAVVGVVVALRVIAALASTQKLVDGVKADVDRTLSEVNRVLVKVEDVADSSRTLIDETDRLMREEVASTLHTARAMLANVEITTRGIADTTTAVRRITSKADSLVDTSKLIAAGSAVAKFAATQGLRAAGGLISGLTSGVYGMLAHRGKHAPAKSNGSKRPEPKNEIIDDRDAGLAVAAVRHKRK